MWRPRHDEGYEPIVEAIKEVHVNTTVDKYISSEIMSGNPLKYHRTPKEGSREQGKQVTGDHQKRPKPDALVVLKNRPRGNIIIWDWKAPTEAAQQLAEEEGSKTYAGTEKVLREEG